MGIYGQDSTQNSFTIDLKPWFKDVPLELNKEYSHQNNPIKIETFRLYLSQFSLLKKGKVVWTEKKSFHLVDASDFKSLKIVLKVPENRKFDQVQFLMGIDSVTNVSGAMGGDLDPTKGMYWTWNSGYINLKIEGQSSLCPTRNNAFQLHLGGYLSPWQTVQTLQFDCRKKNALEIKLDVSHYLDEVDLKTEHTIMSPGEHAMILSKAANNLFRTDEKK